MQHKIYATPRLIIRQLKDSDLDLFYQLETDKRVMRYLDQISQTVDDVRANLNDLIAYYQQEPNEYKVWAVEHRNTTEFLGTVALIYNKSSEHEIGYRFLYKHWGRGYATEALEGLVHHALYQLQLREVFAYVHEKNSTSINVLEKSTMQFFCHKSVNDEPHLCYKVHLAAE